MPIKDQDLRYFLAVAKAGALTKAAQNLGISESALSQRLKALEDGIGQRLMERHGRGVRLTGAGESLRQAVESSFDAIDAGVSELITHQGVTTGTVGIASVHTVIGYYIAPALAAFADLYPQARVALFGRSSEDVVEFTRRGFVDFGVVYGELVADPDLAVTHLFRERLCLVYSPRLPGAASLEKSLALTSTTPLILPPPGYGVRRLAEAAFPDLALNIRYEVDTLDSIVQLTMQGLGVGLVPAPVLRALKDSLRVLSLPGVSLSRQVVLIQRRKTPVPKLARELAQLFATRASTLSDEA